METNNKKIEVEKKFTSFLRFWAVSWWTITLSRLLGRYLSTHSIVIKQKKMERRGEERRGMEIKRFREGERRGEERKASMAGKRETPATYSIGLYSTFTHFTTIFLFFTIKTTTNLDLYF